MASGPQLGWREGQGCAALGSPEAYVQREKGGSALLPLPKALGLMVAGWERPRRDYFTVAEKNALHLDTSAQTVWFSEDDFPSQRAPPPREAAVTQHGG